MIDAITPRERLSRLSQNRWEHRLSLLFFVIALLLCLALMCENVNATDPQRGLNRDLSAGTRHSEPDGSATRPARPSSQGGASQGTAPILLLSHPLCQTGFTIAQRFDERNSAGAIIKSVWVRKCTKGKIIYGGKV